MELKTDIDNETFWLSLNDMAQLFQRNKSVISRHIKNILKDEELDKSSTVAFFATVQKEGNRQISRNIEHFNLDMIISVGYRVNSKVATKFRQWATQTLKQHITQGFTINAKKIQAKQQHFFQTIEDLQLLTKDNHHLASKDVLELIKHFSHTWFALDSYDKNAFPQTGIKQEILITAEELQNDLEKLKQDLMAKNQATLLFAQKKQQGNLQGIVGNIFQSVFGQDAYSSIEEKAAHLLYFIIKNHPFNDGNKRSGAFAFIWFLQKADYNFTEKISSETLTALTILVAESNPQEKERIIGIILLLLNRTDKATDAL